MSDTLGNIIDGLKTVLAKLQDVDLWPPWDAAKTIVDLVGKVIEVATEKPDPEPGDIDDAAAAWRRIGRTWNGACTDVDRTRTKTTTSVWEGDAGHGYRVSLSALEDRMDSVQPAAATISGALGTLSTEMTAARKRHGDAWDDLNEHRTISWKDLNPLELKDKIGKIREAVISAVEDLIGAYQDANSAITTAARTIRNAVDELEIPHELPSGIDPVSAVNLFVGGGDGMTGDSASPPTWPTSADEDIASSVEELNADPALAALGVEAVVPPEAEESEERDAPKSEPHTIRAEEGLAGAVTSITSQGWTLTYAGCLGPGAPQVAEMSRPVGERVAVLRLSQVQSSTTPSEVDAVVVLSTPGWSLPQPSAVSDACFASGEPPTAFSHKGVPSLGPTRLIPLSP